MEATWMDEIPTPALILDYDLMEKNIETMAKFVKENNVNLRPHLKTAKMPYIAHKILKAGGAKGIAVAKVGEAEIFAQCGIDDILIANQVITPDHIRRLMLLNKYIKVRCAVDSKKNVLELQKFAQKTGIILEVLIEVNLGLGRAGISTQEAGLELANVINELTNLKLVGLQGYEGHLTPMMNLEQKEKQTMECMEKVISMRDHLNENGFDINYVSTSGSATYMYAVKSGGVTEIQPGTYVFSDEHLHRVNPIFDVAITVLSTIQNHTGKKEYTCDAGTKAIPTGDGKPIVKGNDKVKIRVMNEEHTQFKVLGSRYDIGSKIEFIPAHICPTINLYDHIHVIKGGEYVGKWQILARGKNY